MKSLLFLFLLAATAVQGQTSGAVGPGGIILKYDLAGKVVKADTCYWEMRADTFQCGWALVADSLGVVHKITPDTIIHTREVKVCRYAGTLPKEVFGSAQREQFWYRGRPIDMIQYRRHGNLKFAFIN